MKKTLYGPRGVRLHLDSNEIYPDDPGAGTPAMVEFKRSWGSLNCAESEGEVDGRPLPEDVLEWLESDEVQNEVDAMYLRKMRIF